jgi:hypothetical protein
MPLHESRDEVPCKVANNVPSIYPYKIPYRIPTKKFFIAYKICLRECRVFFFQRAASFYRAPRSRILASIVRERWLLTLARLVNRKHSFRFPSWMARPSRNTLSVGGVLRDRALWQSALYVDIGITSLCCDSEFRGRFWNSLAVHDNCVPAMPAALAPVAMECTCTRWRIAHARFFNSCGRRVAADDIFTFASFVVSSNSGSEVIFDPALFPARLEEGFVASCDAFEAALTLVEHSCHELVIRLGVNDAIFT